MGTFAKRNGFPLDYGEFLVCDVEVCVYIYI